MLLLTEIGSIIILRYNMWIVEFIPQVADRSLFRYIGVNSKSKQTSAGPDGVLTSPVTTGDSGVLIDINTSKITFSDMDQSLLALLLLALGLAFLVAEIFIPSGGLISVMAVISLTASVFFAWSAWGEDQPTMWWTYLTALVFLLPTTILLAIIILPRTPWGKRIILEGPELEEVTPYVHEEAHLSRLVGKTADTLSLLNPGGMVLVEGERIHCESEGMLIDPGQQVKIIGLKGNRLIVRLDINNDPTNLAADQTTQNSTEDKPKLDFEYPES